LPGLSRKGRAGCDIPARGLHRVTNSLPDNQLGFLVAEIELGLTFARMAERAGDAWLAARQRAKAEQAYETVLGLRDRLDLTQAAHADLSRGLEGLRLAIQRISRA